MKACNRSTACKQRTLWERNTFGTKFGKSIVSSSNRHAIEIRSTWLPAADSGGALQLSCYPPIATGSRQEQNLGTRIFPI